ncbi:MAG: aminotransferase class IV [Planctomycetota bacterium]|nr:aminotransferase class IV [Planctomycetota bacterium]
MPPARVLVHDGHSVQPADRPTVSVLDHGFLFGDSVYEVVRTANGLPFQLHEHLQRLRRSSTMTYFEIPWADEEIAARLARLYEALDTDEAYFRIVATRGPGPLSLLPDGCDEPRLYLIGCELLRYPRWQYEKGCSVAVVRRLRNDPRALDPRAKTGNYLNNMLGFIEARRAGADDALFLNADDHLTESTTSNVWLVQDGSVLTPPVEEGLLPGITREWLFGALPKAGVEVREQVIPRTALEHADEVFLTGTVKGVMPVTRIDGEPVGDGKPGPVTAQAAHLYDAALRANTG